MSLAFKCARVRDPLLLIERQLLLSAHGFRASIDHKTVTSPPFDDVVDGLRLHTRESEHLLHRSHYPLVIRDRAEPEVDHELLLRDRRPRT